MRVFSGERGRDGRVRVYVIDQTTGEVRRLRHRVTAKSHSPAGFEWGYLGSGPAELARALVVEVTGDVDPSPRVYQQVKARVVAQLRGNWTLEEHHLRDVIRAVVGELAVEAAEKGVTHE